MKKGCLLSILIGLTILLSAGLFIWNKKDIILSDVEDTIVSGVKNAFELSERGTEGFIKPRYGAFLDKLDTAAKEAKTIFKFGATIEEIDLPEELIYIGMIKGEETTDVIKKFTWNGHSLKSMGRYGEGTLNVNGQKVLIMTYENGPWGYIDSFVVYIEFKEDSQNN